MRGITQNCFQHLVKALIGLGGLCFFFMTSDEVWGEAIGLTLFFASGQLQSVIKPPFKGKVICGVSSDDLLETWRIMVGITPCMYYFYFVMYQRRSSTIYTSTVCLSLLWESQIVDDLVNLLSYWLSYDLATSAKSFIAKILSMKEKSVKAFVRNIVQDFLCVLCKLYKHLIMNFTKMNCFLLSQVNIGTVATSLITNKMRQNEESAYPERLLNHMEKGSNKGISMDFPALNKGSQGKMKKRNIQPKNGTIGSELKRNGYGSKLYSLTPSFPFSSPQMKSKNPSCNVIIRKQGIRIPVF